MDHETGSRDRALITAEVRTFVVTFEAFFGAVFAVFHRPRICDNDGLRAS